MSKDKHTILCVDDEANILHALRRLLRKEEYGVLTASSGDEGLDILSENDVHLVLTDQRMPGMNGTEFLARVREEYPDVIRIILTGYTDVDTIMDSVNKGNVFKFMLKPWNDQNLKLEIRRALDQYDLVQANRELNERVIKQNEELKGINDNLERMVRERTREIEIQNHALRLSQNILENLNVPIVGVGADGMIVLINRAARSLPGGAGKMEIGKAIHEHLGSETGAALREVVETGTSRSVKAVMPGGETCQMDLIPLTGPFKGKGLVLSLKPV